MPCLFLKRTRNRVILAAALLDPASVIPTVRSTPPKWTRPETSTPPTPVNTNDTVETETPEGPGSENGDSLVDGMNGWDESDPPPQLDLDEGELLSRARGSRGDEVTTVQEMLNEQGADIAVDGIYGPETAAAVEAFQTEHDLKIDGIVGPETQGALNDLFAGENSGDTQVDPENPETPGAEPETPETPETPDTPGADPENPGVPGERGQVDLADPSLTEAERFEHYERMLEANGGEMNLDGPTVLALRGLSADGVHNDSFNNTGGYDDTFVVLDRGPNGEPSVEMFEGSTHANATYSPHSYGPDQNGNTIRGVAMLQPGSYDVAFSGSNYQGTVGSRLSCEDAGGQRLRACLSRHEPRRSHLTRRGDRSR